MLKVLELFSGTGSIGKVVKQFDYVTFYNGIISNILKIILILFGQVLLVMNIVS